jgi:hypothetical protein
MSQAQAVELEWRHEAVESHIASKQKRRQTDLLIMPHLFPMEVILAEEISFLKNDKTMCFQSLKKYPLKMMLHRHCASKAQHPDDIEDVVNEGLEVDPDTGPRHEKIPVAEAPVR